MTYLIDWNVVGTIAEHIAFAISILGVTGLGWYIAGIVIDKVLYRNNKKG